MLNQYCTDRHDDNRAEHDETFSCKTYEMKDGSKKHERHYGFRAHIICDAKYGLPIKSKLTPANNSEQTELDNMIEEMANGKEMYKLKKMKNLMGDAGYSKGLRNKTLKEEYDINPIVDIYYRWDEEEKYIEIENQPLAYNEEGEVLYIVDLGNYEKMKYLGYDKANNALRYTRYSTGKRIYRIPLETDYRIFTPIARDSKKFKKWHKRKNSVKNICILE